MLIRRYPTRIVEGASLRHFKLLRHPAPRDIAILDSGDQRTNPLLPWHLDVIPSLEL